LSADNVAPRHGERCRFARNVPGGPGIGWTCVAVNSIVYVPSPPE
jgi:hypothetical protein